VGKEGPGKKEKKKKKKKEQKRRAEERDNIAIILNQVNIDQGLGKAEPYREIGMNTQIFMSPF
jgi:hypothetical protein